MAGPRIAVVGWGSLIWDPRGLPLGSPWRTDGPALPIEFTRIADNGRLTLGLRDGVADVQTLWADMADRSLQTARAHLAQRERTVPDRIGCLDRQGAASCPLASWLAERELDAVIWTALPANFEERAGRALSVDAAVCHLEGLSTEARRRAEQYVRRAPTQVRTDIRRGLERVLGWTPTP